MKLSLQKSYENVFHFKFDAKGCDIQNVCLKNLQFLATATIDLVFSFGISVGTCDVIIRSLCQNHNIL